jgi:hypothetical protein
MDFFQDDKQSVLDVLGMVSQGVDHPKVHRLTDVSALQEGWHEMSLTKAYEFTWKVHPDYPQSGVKAINIRTSFRGMVTESFCLLYTCFRAVQMVSNGEATCHDRDLENGTRTWKCTNVECSDDGDGLVGLAFRKELEGTPPQPPGGASQGSSGRLRGTRRMSRGTRSSSSTGRPGSSRSKSPTYSMSGQSSRGSIPLRPRSTPEQGIRSENHCLSTS